MPLGPPSAAIRFTRPDTGAEQTSQPNYQKEANLQFSDKRDSTVSLLERGFNAPPIPQKNQQRQQGSATLASQLREAYANVPFKKPRGLLKTAKAKGTTISAAQNREELPIQPVSQEQPADIIPSRDSSPDSPMIMGEEQL